MPIEPLNPSSVLPFEATHWSLEAAAADLPTLSLVMPIYNAGPYLERTLRSLLLNDLDGVEIIVMDGASTDNTPDILAHYAPLFHEMVSEPDSGQSDAINKGFARASGDILGWLNGDDLVLPDTLNAVRAAFRDSPEADVVVGDAAMVDLDLEVTHAFRTAPENLTFAHLLDYASHHLVQPSVFFTRKAWEAAGPLDETLHYAMDADLFLTMARTMTLVHLPREIAYSVYHEEAKTRRHRAASLSELALVEARHGGLEEARRTLDRLVALYNEALAGGGATGEGPGSLMARRLAAVEAETAANRRFLLGTLGTPE
ncbi:MAG: hypothetical protein AcusKO_51050 [Acuticoccus sp.]